MPDPDTIDHAPATSTTAGAGTPGQELPDDARDQWAGAAREVLTGVAGRYHALITHKELAAAVQERTGVHTKQLQQHWIGDVLARVAAECSRRDEPNLSALCVNAQGSVGVGYGTLVRDLTGTTPDDPDAHAADVRLACYRAADATGFPDDGARAALSPQLQASRSRARVVAARDKPADVCPTCHMARLPTGVCDTCD